MTRSQGKATAAWLTQVVHVSDPDITSAAALTLLVQKYFALDKSIYTDWRMAHIRKKWFKQQLKDHRDEAGGLTCAICGKKGLSPFHPFNDDDRATLDHIVDIGKGGPWNDPANFQVACYECNTMKNKRLQMKKTSA